MKIKQNSASKQRTIELLFLVYMLVTVFPYSLLIHDVVLQETVRILFAVIYLIFYFYYSQKEAVHLPMFHKVNSRWLFLLPLLLISGSNLIFLAVSNTPIRLLDQQAFWFSLPLVGLLVVMEELVFRALWIDHMDNAKSPLHTALLSGAIFGLFHFINLFSGSSLGGVLIQMVYTFALGFVCASAYLISKNFVVPVIIHLSFNVLNNQLYPLLASASPNWLYYVINGGIGIVVVGYCVWLLHPYSFGRKKTNV